MFPIATDAFLQTTYVGSEKLVPMIDRPLFTTSSCNS